MKHIVWIIILICIAITVNAKSVDLNQDGCVDDDDLNMLIENYGSEEYDIFDLDEDGEIDLNDHRIINEYKKKGSDKAIYECKGYECSEELCNGIDDDCDMWVDEHCEEIPVDLYCEKETGKNKYEKGIIIADDFEAEDYCFIRKEAEDIGEGEKEEVHSCEGESCFLLEYECNEEKGKNELIYECGYGCWEGACINADCENIDNIEVDLSEKLCSFAIEDCGASFDWIESRCCGDDTNEFARCDEYGNCVCCNNPEDVYINGSCGFIMERTSSEETIAGFNIDTPLVIGALFLLFFVVFLVFMGKKSEPKKTKSNVKKKKTK